MKTFVARMRILVALTTVVMLSLAAVPAKAETAYLPTGTVITYCDNGVTKTEVVGPTWPARPPFFADRSGSWVDWSTAPAGVTEGACQTDPGPQPAAVVVYGDWSGETPTCDLPSVTQSRTVTTTEYVLVDNTWVLGSPITTTETQTVSLTEAELAACQPPDPGPKPDPIVTYGEWGGGEASCDTPEVTQVRSVTTIDFGPGYDGSTWVQLAPVETTETRVDTLTSDEQAACATATVPTDNGGGNVKVFVCKYVGTPGVDERLQTGQNPISVSVNAIPNYQGVGSYFADAQGRSFVLAEDTRTGGGQGGEPGVDQCPPPDTGETPTTVPSETPTVVPSETPTTVPSETPTATTTPDDGDEGQCPAGTTFLVKVEAGQTRIPVPGLIVALTGSTGTFTSTTPIGAVVIKSGSPGGMIDTVLFDAALQGSFETSGGDDISHVLFCSAPAVPTETPTVEPSETPVKPPATQTPVVVTDGCEAFGNCTPTPEPTTVPGGGGHHNDGGDTPSTNTGEPVTSMPDTGTGTGWRPIGGGSSDPWLPLAATCLLSVLSAAYVWRYGFSLPQRNQ